MRSRNPGWVPAQWVCSWLRPVALLSQARVCAALAGSNPASTIMWSAPRSASVSLSRENPSVAKSSISRNRSTAVRLPVTMATTKDSNVPALARSMNWARWRLAVCHLMAQHERPPLSVQTQQEHAARDEDVARCTDRVGNWRIEDDQLVRDIGPA